MYEERLSWVHVTRHLNRISHCGFPRFPNGDEGIAGTPIRYTILISPHLATNELSALPSDQGLPAASATPYLNALRRKAEYDNCLIPSTILLSSGRANGYAYHGDDYS